MAKDPQRYQELVAQALEDRRAWLLAQPLPAPPAITKATVLSFLARQDAAAAAAAASSAAAAAAAAPPPPPMPAAAAVAAAAPLAAQEEAAAPAPPGATEGDFLGSIAALRSSDLPLPRCAAYLAALRTLSARGSDSEGTEAQEAGAAAPALPAPTQARLAEALLATWRREPQAALAEALLWQPPSLAPEPQQPPPPPPPPQQQQQPRAALPGPPVPQPAAAPDEGGLVARLLHPTAAELAHKIRQFIKNFSNQDFRALLAAQRDDYAFFDKIEREEAAAAGEEGAQAAADGGASLDGGSAPPPQQQPPAVTAADRKASWLAAAAAAPPPPTAAAPAAAPAAASPKPPTPRARPPPPPSEGLHKFLAALEAEVAQHPLFRATPPTPALPARLSEELERLLLTRLHSRIFGAHPHAAARDALCAQRLASLSFVHYSHLGLATPSPRLAPAWRLAAAAFRAMAAFPAPGDKLVLIMGACVTLSHALSLGKEEVGKVGASICADDVMPAIMHCLIRANPGQLLSQLRHIEEWRPQGKLAGEQGYWLTSLNAALVYLMRAGAKDMGVGSEAEFQELRRAAWLPVVAQALAGAEEAGELCAAEAAVVGEWEAQMEALAAAQPEMARLVSMMVRFRQQQHALTAAPL